MNFEDILDLVQKELKAQSAITPISAQVRLPQVKLSLVGVQQTKFTARLRKAWGHRNSPRYFLGLYFRLPILGPFSKWLSNLILINKRLSELETNIQHTQNLMLKLDKNSVSRGIQRESFLLSRLRLLESKLDQFHE